MNLTKAQVAAANDLFRQTMTTSPRHKIMLTRGLADSVECEDVITKVRAFDKFTKYNDPHGEHDMGSVNVAGELFFFKIDYYDRNFEWGADPYTDDYVMVLTIMRADEY